MSSSLSLCTPERLCSYSKQTNHGIEISAKEPRISTTTITTHTKKDQTIISFPSPPKKVTSLLPLLARPRLPRPAPPTQHEQHSTGHCISLHHLTLLLPLRCDFFHFLFFLPFLPQFFFFHSTIFSYLYLIPLSYRPYRFPRCPLILEKKNSRFSRIGDIDMVLS